MDNFLYYVFIIFFIGVMLGAVYYMYIKPSGITFGGFGRGSSKIKSGLCPFCNSDDVIYSPKRQLWSCNKCKDVFAKPKPVEKPYTKGVTKK